MSKMDNILLFRVSTSEILIELHYRSKFHVGRDTFKEFSSKELLEYILDNRMDSFEK